MLIQNFKVKSFSAKKSELNLLTVVKKEMIVIVETEIVVIVVIEIVMTETVVIVPRRKQLNVLFVKKQDIGLMNVPMVLAKVVLRKELASFVEVPSIR